jgi:hypothetical protein
MSRGVRLQADHASRCHVASPSADLAVARELEPNITDVMLPCVVRRVRLKPDATSVALASL